MIIGEKSLRTKLENFQHCVFIKGVLHSGIEHQLSFSNFKDLLLNGVFNHKPVNEHIIFLTDSVSTCQRLLIIMGVEITVHYEYSVSLRQVDPKAACSCRKQEYLDFRIIKLVNELLAAARWRISRQHQMHDLNRVEVIRYNAQHSLELTED